MFGDVNFFVFIYDDKIDFVEWLVEYGWVVDFVCSIFELQVGYGLILLDVDVKIDSFMCFQYIMVVRV